MRPSDDGARPYGLSGTRRNRATAADARAAESPVDDRSLALPRKVPTCAHDRVCDFRPVAEARERSAVRISWSMIFIKAFGMVAARYPALRQMYLPLPWPHIYQHPTSVAMVATHRDFRGEPWLFWSRFTTPERRPLPVLQAALERYQTARVKEVFPWQLQLSGMPTPLRRLLWSWTFYVGGKGPRAAVGDLFPHDDRRAGGRNPASARFSDIERHLRPDRRKRQEPRDDRV